MPKFNDTPVATVRDLADYFTAIADAVGDNVVPYFWNNFEDREFVLLESLKNNPPEEVGRVFIALETFNPDPEPRL